MRATLLLLALSATMLLAFECQGAAPHPCIPKATAALPRAAVLIVKQTRVRPASAAILSTWKGRSQPIMVDVEFVAAGAAEQYSFLCVVTQGSAFVQRTMN